MTKAVETDHALRVTSQPVKIKTLKLYSRAPNCIRELYQLRQIQTHRFSLNFLLKHTSCSVFIFEASVYEALCIPTQHSESSRRAYVTLLIEPQLLAFSIARASSHNTYTVHMHSLRTYIAHMHASAYTVRP